MNLFGLYSNHREMLMRKALFFTCFSFVCIQGPDAQEIATARKIIEDLTSPNMHGRGFVRNGVDKAAKYIVKAYKKNGIQPVKGCYSQWFCVDVNTFPGPVRLSVNNNLLKPGIDYLPNPSSPGIKGTFGLVEINTDDILSDRGITKLKQAGIDQLLYLNLLKSDSLNDLQKKAVADFRDILKKSESFQAAGVVEISNKKPMWHSSQQCMNKPWINLYTAITVDSASKVKAVIKNRLVLQRKTRNIMGYCKGTVMPDSFIVLTAHYDHIGSLGKKAYFPGANDNASGVAMLLSLMRYFTIHPPAKSLIFLATSAEELGIIGSRYFVENPSVYLNKIRFLINFDLAGTGEEGIMVVNASVHPQEFEILVNLNKKDSLLPDIKMRGEACNSDHCPFHLKGVPCFFIYTLGGSKAYHDLYDKSEAISLAAFENYIKLIIRFLEKL
ncbi:MAG: M20/M25/M40 family metallo-hydrolase [Bacteroidales bacterium]|nr:M20/M25/M40 family metallo-hydrolase [Bacteroidales bacterium]